LRALLHPAALLLAAANLAVVIGHYGIDSFLPSILTRWYGLSLGQVGWVIVPPFVAVLLGQLLVSWHSDRTGERWFHAMLPLFVGAAALALTPLTRGSLALTIAVFCVAGAGIRSYLPPFFALLGRLLEGTAAASAIGLIQTVGNLGGFLGPRIVGKLEATTGSFEGGLYVLAGSSFVSGLCVVTLWLLRRRREDFPSVDPPFSSTLRS
jgi:predicted MFS family arabinose efflux permease